MPLTLDGMRNKIIQITFILTIVNTFVIFIIHAIEQRYDDAIIGLVAIICLSLILYLSRIGYAQIGAVMGAIFCFIFAFNECYKSGVLIHSVIYFSLTPTVYALLIKNRTIRIIYLIINLITFFGLNALSNSGEWSDIFTMIIGITLSYLIILLFIDLMEKQQEQLLLALDEKNTALDVLRVKHNDVLLFTSMMNHDIKAPLNTVKGFIGLLQKEEHSERANKYIKHITELLKSLDSMILNLLALTKMNTTELELSNTDLNHIVEQVCGALQYDIQKENVNIVKDTLPQIQGNSEALRTIFQNLISNAIKYQPKNKPEHVPTINIIHESSQQEDIIYIQDNGIGIKQENIPQLFMPFKRFHTSKEYEGTGLGMSICKKIMEKHKGDIVYLSTNETGTCFKLAFPKNSMKRV